MLKDLNKVNIFFPPLNAPPEEELKAAYALIEQNNKAIKEQKRTTLVQCYHCNTLHKISDLIYIQTHWYTPPHGCTGGDYLTAGEGQFKCPNCELINRLYNSKNVEELKQYFLEVVNSSND